MYTSALRLARKPFCGSEVIIRNVAAHQQARRGWWLRSAGIFSAFALILSGGALPASGNIPGGGTGAGPDVTLVENPDNTVTMSNGIVTVVINRSKCSINSVTYTDSTTGTTTQVSGGQRFGGFIATVSDPNTSIRYDAAGAYDYTRFIDPAQNGGARADVRLVRTAPAKIGGFEVHFTMQRGSPGFYTTGIFSHGIGDVPLNQNAVGYAISAPPIFNWMTVDPARNFLVGAHPTKYNSFGLPTPIPKESGIAADGGWYGRFDNKFLEAEDYSNRKAWGWSSVGTGNPNLGVWTMTNMEYSSGGPMKRDVTCTPFNGMISNCFLTGELGGGIDALFAQDERWSKVCGPFFYYVNKVSPSIADPGQAAKALYEDALAQDAAEKAAWPYSWAQFSGYTPASGRGTVTGQLTINDTGNPTPVVAGTWVGVVQQPPTSKAPLYYDQALWVKPYQYWTQTDSGGHFTIPDVNAGSNYTLWAYGAGVAGSFLSQEQRGGRPRYEYTLPANPAPIVVTGDGTTTVNLTWTPKRVGATVFELGIPDRHPDEFRHGEDFWEAETPPARGYPTPVWGGQAYFLQEYPTGNVNYTVGASRWDTDWNFVLPSEYDASGVYETSSATINFNLATAPAADAQVSLYVGVSSCNFYRYNANGLQFKMNTTDLVTGGSITAAPFTPITSAGLSPGVSAPGDGGLQGNSTIHLSDHGAFLDERINFPGSALKAGLNTLKITMAQPGYSNHVVFDYLRLELAGYVPPPPAQPVVYPGNARNLVTWRVVPGAARYNVLRKGGTDTGYTSKGGTVGAVSGSDTSVMTWVDTAATNGTAYTYEVQSWNVSSGNSAASVPSAAVAPAASYSQAAPAAPTGVKTTTSHHNATVSWTRSPGAQYYAVSRTTLGDDLNGGGNVLRTIVVNDYLADPAATFVDTSVTDGKFYDYSVRAFNAAGGSASSALARAHPLPPAPSSAPSALSATALSATSVKLTWTPVPNATGYVIYRSTTPGGTLNVRDNFLYTLVATNFTDNKATKQTTYYYQVTAVNSAGKSSPALVSATTK